MNGISVKITLIISRYSPLGAPNLFNYYCTFFKVINSILVGGYVCIGKYGVYRTKSY